MDKKLIKRTFSRQLDQSDCGVACLLSIMRYHGCFKSLEQLREKSGTSKQGTTLLGLFKAAQDLWFSVKGYESEFNSIQNQSYPSILHVILEDRMQHYIVCYGYEKGYYLIGDPARGLLELSEDELAKIWKSKSLLELIPNDCIEQIRQVNKDKWNWFKAAIREDTGLLFIIFGLSLVVAILGMAMAVFSQKLIDVILPAKNIEKLILGLLLITLLLIARSGISYIAGSFGIMQGQGFNNRLIVRFFDSLVYLPKYFFDNRRIGELVERMNDTARVQTAIAAVVGDLLKNFLLFIAGEVILFVYSPLLALISLASVPIFGVISWQFHHRIIRGQWEVMSANAHKSSNYVDSMKGIDAIKSSQKEKDFSLLNKLIYGHYQAKIVALGKVGISLQLVAEIASVLITITLISIGSLMILSGNLTVGGLMAVLGVSGGIFPAIVSLAFANISLQGAKVAFDRMFEFSAIKPEFENISADNAATIKNIASVGVKNLSFRFPGRKLLLKEITLELKQGQIVTLLGESGSGKTTMLNLIQRYSEPESGEICLNGVSVNQFYIPEWRKQIGVVPQEINLFNGTLMYNICFSTLTDQMQHCLDFCIQSGLHQYFMEFPQNYNTLLGEEGINISGGQRQLVGLARALWSNPGFLILDEPTAAMDRNMENFVLNLIRNLKGNRCIIIVTHRIKIARFSDQIYVLEKGFIKSSGNHEELMQSENLYSSSYRELTTM